MIVNVRMLAYQPTELVRPVEIPDLEAHFHYVADMTEKDPVHLLESVFHYGQNDHCNDRAITSTTCSVSMGDIIELPPDESGDSRNYLILPFGYHKLTDAEYEDYKALDQRDRKLAVIDISKDYEE